jgi:outer membrane scaffolding protein for murein synthesis (MipA/OmpV family)
MTKLIRILRLVLACASSTLALGVLAATPAHATDQSNNWSLECTSGRGCFYEGDVGSYYRISSQSRDSDFQNEYYRNASAHPVNDHVKVWENTFSTLKIQAFLDTNYRRSTYCLNPGYRAGPYPIGNKDGLSSFKSC